MRVVLLGYNGLLGSHILNQLISHINKNYQFDLICVGRNIRNQPFNNIKLKYIKWDFVSFTKTKLSFLNKENIIINCVGKNSNSEKNLDKINVVFIKKLINYIQKSRILVRFIHLGSVSVYGAEKKYINKVVNITEDSEINPYDLYSKSKLKSELYIRNFAKINKKNFSYTILRIANVFSDLKNPNSFILINFLLKKGIWFKCSDSTNYHFIHAKDIALAVLLCISNLKKSKNKIYIVSDDSNQFELHKIYSIRQAFKILKIPISLKFIDLIIKHIPLPSIIFNFLLSISSQVTYDNHKIKKELNFKTIHSLRKIF